MSNDAFDLNDNVCLTLRGRIYDVEGKCHQIFLPTMQTMTKFGDELLKVLLIMRGEKYTLDGTPYSEEDVKKQLLDIKAQHGFSMGNEEFIQMARKLYENFCFAKNKKGELKPKSKGRDFANVFFNDKVNKIPKCAPNEIEEFRNKNVFPIKIDNRLISDYSREGTPLKYSITQSVLEKLTSMEEISSQYELDKNKWKQAIDKSIEKFPKIERYERFLLDIMKIKKMSKFSSDNYRRFLRNWRDKIDRETKNILKQGMHSYFKTLDPKHEFAPEDQYKFGYCHEFMNMIFSSYKDMWETFGNQEYINIIFESFHWRKDSIGISSFGRNGKLLPIHLSDTNYVPFDLVKKESVFHLKIKNLFDQKDDDHSLIICKSPHFCETTTIEKIKTEVKKKTVATDSTINEEKKFREHMLIRYCADSKKSVYFNGMLKEPSLRYDKDRRCFYLDVRLSEHKSERSCLTVNDQKNLLYYFRSSSPSNSRQSEKHVIPDGCYRVMGIDVGLKIPFVGAIYNVEVKNGKITHHFDKIIKSYVNQNAEERCAKIEQINKKMHSAKFLIDVTRNYFYNHEEIPNTYTSKKRNHYERYDFEKDLNINMDEYRDFAGKHKNSGNLVEMRNNREWVLHTILQDIDKLVKEMRMEYFNNKNKSEYCRKCNFTDLSVFLKKKMVLDYISLKRSFSTIGLESKDTSYFRNGFCKHLYKWHEGLVRHCHSIDSDIINRALKENVSIIFIEDLDIHTSATDEKEENKLKSLWGWGEIKVWLGHQARKHNMAIVAVNPHLTSSVHYDTGLKGFEDTKKRTILIPYNEKIISIDRDENAAHNIALRGIYRHSNMREFPVEKIGEDTYRLKNLTGRKQIMGAIFHHVGKVEGVFVKSENGNGYRFRDFDKNKDEREAKPLEDCKKKMFLNGSIWQLRDEIDKRLEEQFGKK